MKSFSHALLSLGILPAVLCFSGITAEAADKTIELFQGTVASMTGVAGGKPIPVQIYVYSYTPEEEVAQLAQVLRTGGQYELRKALSKVERGRIAPAWGAGSPISYIREIKTDAGRILRFVTSRTLAFVEVANATRSADYMFGIVELQVPADGKITGSIIGAAKMKLSDTGTLDVETFGNDSVSLLNLRKVR